MSLKIEILSTAVEVKSGLSSKGKPYEIKSQIAYLYIAGEPYPTKMTINLRDIRPYNVGFYCLDDKSFYVDGYSNLSVSPVLSLLPDIKK